MTAAHLVAIAAAFVGIASMAYAQDAAPTGGALIEPRVTVTQASDDRSWHLLTRTFGGTVSLLKDLTKHECEEVRMRVAQGPDALVGQLALDGQMMTAECFQ